MKHIHTFESFLSKSQVNEGDMTKDYDGFIVINYKTEKNYKFRYIKGTNNVKVEDEAIAKLMKDTRQPRATFAVNGFVRKGEWDKSDAEVLESVNEAAGLAYWSDYSKGHPSQSPKWMSDEAKTVSEVVALVDKCIKHWNQEVEEKGNEVSKSSEKHIGDLAMQYFKQFKTINGNIIDAMISQES